MLYLLISTGFPGQMLLIFSTNFLAFILPTSLFVLENGLKEIGTYAFNGCLELMEITMPSSVEVIDKCAFFGCSNLKVVNLNEGLKIIEISAFYKTGIEEITIPGSVEKIGEFAFCGCENAEIKLMKLKKSRKIGPCAFKDCKKLIRE